MSIKTDFIFAGYQRVERIGSSGTQYINTNTYLNSNGKVEIKYNVITAKTWATIFGQRNSGTQRFTVRYNENANTGIGFQRSSPPSSTYQETNYNLNQSDTNIHIINFGKYVYVDGNLVYTFSNSTGGNYSIPLYIFDLSEPGASYPFNPSAIKLYYFKIWNENGVLIKDFYPVYRKSDNVIGLLDTVNKVFYTNQGTGSFTKGPDVN